MTSRLLLLVSFFMLAGLGLNAQMSCTPLTNAVQSPITLITTSGTANRSAVAWNPVDSLYYTCNAGSSGYPFEAYSDTGGNAVSSTTGGISWRGLWWNSNLGQLEGNGHGSTGMRKVDLNASGIPTGTLTTIFTGQNQPNTQSCGDYDYQANEIIYLDDSTIYRRNRTTNASIGSYSLNLPTFVTNIVDYRAVYTACTGYEIAVYDYTNQQVHLFDKSNGSHTGTVQLPGSAPQPPSFGIGFANDLFWVFDGTGRIWYSYRLFQVCPANFANITTPGDSSICRGDSAILNAPVDPAYSYQWYLNGSILPSATDSMIYADTAGTYSLVITDTMGCTDSSAGLLISQKPDAMAMFSPSGSFDICNGDSFTFTANSNPNYSWQWHLNGSPISGATDSLYVAYSSGSYSVNVVNPSGCTDESGSSNLTVNPNPSPSITANGDTLMTVAGFASYQWYESGTMISGATGMSYVVSSTGTFSVEVTDSNGCSGISDTTFIFVGLTGDLDKADLKIYPVPAKDMIYASFNSSDLGNGEILLLDIRGKVLKEKNFLIQPGDQKVEIDLKELPAGVYFMKIKLNDKSGSKKILIQR